MELSNKDTHSLLQLEYFSTKTTHINTYINIFKVTRGLQWNHLIKPHVSNNSKCFHLTEFCQQFIVFLTFWLEQQIPQYCPRLCLDHHCNHHL